MSDATTVVTLQGKVKWFSTDKGYGFITDEKNQDFYFSVKDVTGQKLPTIGSVVSFCPHQNEKGDRAKSVNILELSDDTDLHVRCSGCKKKMIPRIVFDDGLAHHSICPFCATRHKKFVSFGKAVLLFFLDIIILFLGRRNR